MCARALFEAIQAFSHDMISDTHLREIHVANLDDETTAMFSAIFAQLIETGHHMEAPPTGGYDSDISAGSAAINLDMPLGSKAARKKRRSHVKPSQTDGGEREPSPPPLAQENLASIEQRYERQASDLEERSSQVSYGSMAVYPDSDQPDMPMSSFVIRQMENPPTQHGQVDMDHRHDSASSKRLGNLQDFLSGLEDKTADLSLQGHRENTVGQTFVKTTSPSPAHLEPVSPSRKNTYTNAPGGSYKDQPTQALSGGTGGHYPQSLPPDDASEVTSPLPSPHQASTQPVSQFGAEKESLVASMSSSGRSRRRKKPTLGGQMEWEVNRKVSLEGQEGTGAIVVTFVFPESSFVVRVNFRYKVSQALN